MYICTYTYVRIHLYIHMYVCVYIYIAYIILGYKVPDTQYTVYPILSIFLILQIDKHDVADVDIISDRPILILIPIF